MPDATEYFVIPHRPLAEFARAVLQAVKVPGDAAALVVGNAAQNIKQGVAMAEAVLRDGRALAMLEKLRAVTGKLAE